MSANFTNITIETVLPIIRQIADQYLTREASQQITIKGDSNFVTRVDTNIETAMKAQLSSLFPQIQFMGEESDNHNLDFSRPLWILDPVDGTSNLIHDFQNSSMSLALAVEGSIIFGVIYHYSTGEYFYAKRGEGAYLGRLSSCHGTPDSYHVSLENQIPLQVSSITSLSRSLVSFGTSPYDKATLGEKNCETLKQIFFLCEDIRRIGSAAIELAYVAAGRVDLYLERNLKPWDYAAAIVIIEEAGGIITDYQGQPINIFAPCDILAGNKIVHEKLRNSISL